MLENIRDNPIMLTDVYNLSHHILKENVDWEISHIYNRAKPMVLYGFNEIVTSLLNTKIEVDMVEAAQNHAKRMNMPFPFEMWYTIADRFGGRIPLKVEALRDGTWCPRGTPFAKVTNTEEGFGELVTWWEGVMLQASFPSGCATRAYELMKYMKKHGMYKGRIHSFGFRGHRSLEDAYWAGTAWNLFLNGTDDFHTAQHTEGYMTSIPATAHKTIQQYNTELYAYYYSIDQCRINGFKAVAIVIDTYDPIRFIKFIAVKVAQYAKKSGVHVVFRPDSGHIKDQALSLYSIMWANNLADYTSCILGEGITFDKITEYDKWFNEMGVPLSWINYGIGSGFYNDIDRDYLGFAMKTSYSNGAPRMKFSTPFKQSLPGDVSAIKDDNGLMLVGYSKYNMYNTIYEFDERSSRPKVKVDDWYHIFNSVQSIDDRQKDIIISQEVSDRIKELKSELVDNVMEY